MMDPILIYPTTNLSIIRKILLRKDILNDILNENEHVDPYHINYHKLHDPNLLILQIRRRVDFAGLIFFTFETPGTVKVDVAFLENLRGKYAYYTAKLLIDYMQKNHNVHTIYGRIKKTNKKSIYFARKMHFKIIDDDNLNYVRAIYYG